jgi:hypothetical protein
MSSNAKSSAPQVEQVNIRPGVAILSVLQHLNYKPWFALAEFVDNSLQSFLAHRSELQNIHGEDVKLKVEIEFDPSPPGRVVVRDNAAGIAGSDYARAFKAAEIPPDQSGLSEFGMGMKSAACWLAGKWSVRSKALKESVERFVVLDVGTIVQNKIEELDVLPSPAAPDAHFTELVLESLHRPPHGRTIGKIKEHLASIYRVFLRENILELFFDYEPLTYEEPPILCVPYYKTPLSEPVRWRKEINFDFGQNQRVFGFAALRERASVSGAGFALFRRNRLIQGGGDDGYRPEAVFGKSNSYRYQRLFGELHLEGFDVTHTKDGFRWEEHEDIFLELLSEYLNSTPLPLLTQAEEYRVRPTRKTLEASAKVAAERTAEIIARDVPQVIEKQIKAGPVTTPPPVVLSTTELMMTERVIDVQLCGQPWRIVIQLTSDPAIGDWVSVSDRSPVSHDGIERRCVSVRMSLAHPFMDRFGGTDGSAIEPLLRLAAAIGLAETAARDAGVLMAGTFKRNINELLRDALSNP